MHNSCLILTSNALQVSRCSKHLRLYAGPCGSQLHLPDCSFLERLDAVEEELALNTSCHSYQVSSILSAEDVTVMCYLPLSLSVPCSL